GQGREELKPRGLEASLGVMERRADAATAFARSRRARPIDRHRPLVSALTGLYRQARQEAQPVIFSRLTQLCVDYGLIDKRQAAVDLEGVADAKPRPPAAD